MKLHKADIIKFNAKILLNSSKGKTLEGPSFRNKLLNQTACSYGNDLNV